MASGRQVPTFRTRASRWSHAVFMPVTARPVSRRPPSFVPGQRLEPGFGDVPTLSTRQQRFTRVRLTSAHLTGDPRLFRNAHHPGHWTGAACGGLDPDPAIRVRGAGPHLLCSRLHRVGLLHHSLLFAPSWRTIVGIPFEPDFRKLSGHPKIKRVMQEEISQQWRYHPTHNLAKLPFDLSATIPRERLRPSYRDGFWGAPLRLCRLFGEGQPAGGGADGPQGAAPRGSGEP